MGTHDWGIITTTIGSVLAPLKGGGGAPFRRRPGAAAAAGAAGNRRRGRQPLTPPGKRRRRCVCRSRELTTLDATANERLEAIVASGEAG